MAQPQKTIFFYAPQLAPYESSAAAIRCKAIADAFHANPQVQLQILSSHNLICKLASNKSRLFIRLLFEILVGFELALRLVMIRLTGQPLVLFSSPPYVTCLMASFACHILNLPYALDIRDPYPEVYFQQNIFSRESLMGELQTNLARQFYMHSQCVFTVTEGCKQIIKNYLTVDSKTANRTEPPKKDTPPVTPDNNTPPVHVVRNGYVSSAFATPNQKRNKFTCVFHGNLGLMQNISLLRQVIEQTLARTSDVRFVVVGSGPQENIIQNIQHANCEVLGEVPFEKIPELLKSCHVGLSFRNDGDYSDIAFPVKIFEYIGAEIPTLTTPHSSSIAELGAQKMAKIYANSDAHEIVNQICHWAEHITHPQSAHALEYSEYVDHIRRYKHNYSREGGAKFLADQCANLQT